MLRRIIAAIFSLVAFGAWWLVPVAGQTGQQAPAYPVYLPLTRHDATPTTEPTATVQPTATTEPTAIPTPPDVTGWVTVFQDDFEGAFPGPWILADLNEAEFGEYLPARRDCQRFS